MVGSHTSSMATQISLPYSAPMYDAMHFFVLMKRSAKQEPTKSKCVLLAQCLHHQILLALGVAVVSVMVTQNPHAMAVWPSIADVIVSSQLLHPPLHPVKATCLPLFYIIVSLVLLLVVIGLVLSFCLLYVLFIICRFVL